MDNGTDDDPTPIPTTISGPDVDRLADVFGGFERTLRQTARLIAATPLAQRRQFAKQVAEILRDAGTAGHEYARSVEDEIRAEDSRAHRVKEGE